MPGEASSADQTMRLAAASLANQRAGGRRLVAAPSIGRHSLELRHRNAWLRLKMAGIGVGAVLALSVVAGLIIGGIGFWGLMIAGAAVLGVGALALRVPRLSVPLREALPKGNLTAMIGNVELWLEAQRPSLPAPAIGLIDQIGAQLDGLGVQIARLGDDAPASDEVRRLVGEHLPELVNAYTSIPATLRREPRAGASPDDQLTASLTHISGEIDGLTRRLADGALDRLAIQSRYLDSKYGAEYGDEMAD